MKLRDSDLLKYFVGFRSSLSATLSVTLLYEIAFFLLIGTSFLPLVHYLYCTLTKTAKMAANTCVKGGRTILYTINTYIYFTTGLYNAYHEEFIDN